MRVARTWALLGCLLVSLAGCAAGGGPVGQPPLSPRSSAAMKPPKDLSEWKNADLPPGPLPPGPANKEPYCVWKGADVQAVDAANQELVLSADERARALATHLPFGVPPPRSKQQRLRVLKQFVIEYDGELRAPIWTAYRLAPADVIEAERREAFRADPLLEPELRAECRDYKEPIFDIGHLVPRADMNRSESAMLNSFILSNMTPQHCATNRGPWLVLEDLVRQWAAEGPLLVYSGALYDWHPPAGEDPPAEVPRMLSPNYPKEMGEVRRVGVPSHLFKIVIRLHADVDAGPLEGIALLVPNSPRKVTKAELEGYLESAIVEPQRIQALTGVRFFPRLHRDAPALEAALLSRRPAQLWKYAKLTPQLTGACKADYPSY